MDRDIKSYNIHGKIYPVIGRASYRKLKFPGRNCSPEERLIHAISDPKNEDEFNTRNTYDVINLFSGATEMSRTHLALVVNNKPLLVDRAFLYFRRKK